MSIISTEELPVDENGKPVAYDNKNRDPNREQYKKPEENIILLFK